MKTLLTLIAVLFVGCGKKEPVHPSASNTEAIRPEPTKVKASMPKPVPVRARNSRRENTYGSVGLIDEGKLIG